MLCTACKAEVQTTQNRLILPPCCLNCECEDLRRKQPWLALEHHRSRKSRISRDLGDAKELSVLRSHSFESTRKIHDSGSPILLPPTEKSWGNSGWCVGSKFVGKSAVQVLESLDFCYYLTGVIKRSPDSEVVPSHEFCALSASQPSVSRVELSISTPRRWKQLRARPFITSSQCSLCYIKPNQTKQTNKQTNTITKCFRIS